MNQIYRMLDADGVLLYVGATNQRERRMWQHSDCQPWWHLVARIELEHLDCTRDELEEIEGRAIESELPRYNLRKNPNWREARAALALLRTDDEVVIRLEPRDWRCVTVKRNGEPCGNAREIGFDTCCAHRPRVSAATNATSNHSANCAGSNATGSPASTTTNER